MLTALTRETGRLLCDQANTGWRWPGRTVKPVDGTGISMPDTPTNQAQYPQSSNQAPGIGLPLARLVGGDLFVRPLVTAALRRTWPIALHEGMSAFRISSVPLETKSAPGPGRSNAGILKPARARDLSSTCHR